MNWTHTELMTVAAARLLDDDDVCFVGIGLPSAACNLARLTHAPRITLVYESGAAELAETAEPTSHELSVLRDLHRRTADAHGAMEVA